MVKNMGKHNKPSLILGHIEGASFSNPWTLLGLQFKPAYIQYTLYKKAHKLFFLTV